jgi:hypothetical protein
VLTVAVFLSIVWHQSAASPKAFKCVMKKLVRSCLKNLARRQFMQRILQEELDLRCLKRKPTAREQFGIVLVLFSYVIGWPAVAFFGFLSLYLKKPLVLIIGGPLTYGIAHGVFLVGMYIAGKDYTMLLMKWSIKKACEKLSAGGPQQPGDAVKIE